MKKTAILTMVSVLFAANSMLVSVKGNDLNLNATSSISEITDLGDGYYKEVIIVEETLTRAAKNGYKTINYYNGSTVLWSLTIHGTFTYTGSSATCTNAYVTSSCPSSDWRLTSTQARRSGAYAIGSVEARKYFAGVNINTIKDEVKLGCSGNGTLS